MESLGSPYWDDGISSRSELEGGYGRYTMSLCDLLYLSLNDYLDASVQLLSSLPGCNFGLPTTSTSSTLSTTDNTPRTSNL